MMLGNQEAVYPYFLLKSWLRWHNKQFFFPVAIYSGTTRISLTNGGWRLAKDWFGGCQPTLEYFVERHDPLTVNLRKPIGF